MTTYNHTDVLVGAPASASTLNNPMGQLDAAIGDKTTLKTTIQTSLVAALNEIIEQSAINIMLDPYNKFAPTTLANWTIGSRLRIYDGAGFSIVDPDASNPFNGRTLRLSGTAGINGKRIYLDEFGGKEGDVLTFAALVKGTNAETFRLNVFAWNSSSVLVQTFTGGVHTANGAVQTMVSTVVTIPAGAKGGSLIICPVRVSASNPLDIYAMWGRWGSSAGVNPIPSIFEPPVMLDLIDARGSFSTLDGRLDDHDASINGIQYNFLNLVFDPFNKYVNPNVDWGGRVRWFQGSFLTKIDPDANNPFGCPTLRMGTGVSQTAKRLYMDELGLREGDTVSFAMLVTAASGTFNIQVYFWNSSDGIITGFSGTPLVFTGQTATLSKENITVPAGAKGGSIQVILIRTAGAVTADIYAMWGVRGAKAGLLPAPIDNATYRWQEIIDGRGGLTSLDSRLDVIESDVSAIEAQIQPTSRGKRYLRDWRAKISRIEDGLTEQAVIGFCGDSWVENEPLCRRLREFLQTLYGDAGVGWLSAARVNNTIEGATPVTRAGTWTLVDNSNSALGVDLTHASSTDIATPASVQLIATFQTVKIHYYKQTGGGSFRYRVDAGGWTTIDTNSAAGYSIETISGLSNAQHTIDIEVTVAGAQGVILFGFDCQKTAAGVRVHNLGNASTTTTLWVGVNAANWQTGFAALGCNVGLQILGTNDQNSVTPATFRTNLETWCDRVRAALPRCDVLLLSPADNGSPGTYSIQDYNTKMGEAADTKLACFVSGYDNFGLYADANARGLWGDTLHPNNYGYRTLASLLFDLALRIR